MAIGTAALRRILALLMALVLLGSVGGVSACGAVSPSAARSAALQGPVEPPSLLAAPAHSAQKPENEASPRPLVTAGAVGISAIAAAVLAGAWRHRYLKLRRGPGYASKFLQEGLTVTSRKSRELP